MGGEPLKLLETLHQGLPSPPPSSPGESWVTRVSSAGRQTAGVGAHGPSSGGRAWQSPMAGPPVLKSLMSPVCSAVTEPRRTSLVRRPWRPGRGHTVGRFRGPGSILGGASCASVPRAPLPGCRSNQRRVSHVACGTAGVQSIPSSPCVILPPVFEAERAPSIHRWSEKQATSLSTLAWPVSLVYVRPVRSPGRPRLSVLFVFKSGGRTRGLSAAGEVTM